MRFINVRQLLSNFEESTTELPVTVTRFGKPYFVIKSIEEVGTALKEDVREKNFKKISKPIKVVARTPITVVQTEGPRGFERLCSIALCRKPAVGQNADGEWRCKEHL